MTFARAAATTPVIRPRFGSSDLKTEAAFLRKSTFETAIIHAMLRATSLAMIRHSRSMTGVVKYEARDALLDDTHFTTGRHYAPEMRWS